MKPWKTIRDEILSELSTLQTIPQNDRLCFSSGEVSNVAIKFKYGFIGINRDNLLVLGIKQSIPKNIAIRLIQTLEQYIAKRKVNMGIVPLDEIGRPIESNGYVGIRI